MKANGNLIVDLTFEFALEILAYTGVLEEKKKFVVARQLCKSGTSIGANVVESQSAESKADFIHKMKVAAKEAQETAYWLRLCSHSQYMPGPPETLIEKVTSVNKVLSAIISSAKKRP